MSEFYVQDSRDYVGNDILWWAKNAVGYTTDLTKAHIFTELEAIKQNQSRDTDIPWPKDYIDQRTRPAVDMQYVDITIALQGTGIELARPEEIFKSSYRCEGCGVFMSEYQLYSGPCRYCDCDNRP